MVELSKFEALQRRLDEATLQLRETEARLAISQRTARLGTWEVELKCQDFNANPCLWSDEVYRIFGLTPGECEITMPLVISLVHPDDRPLMLSAIQASRSSGNAPDYVHRILRPDATVRVVHERAEFELDPQTGVPIKMVGTVQDITESIGAEQALLESRSQWRALVENAPDIIIHVDCNGIIQFINRVVPPFKPEEVVGTSWTLYVPLSQQSILTSALKTVLSTGAPVFYEISAAGPNGTLSWYSTHMGPIIRDGETVGAVLMNRDISQKKQMEAQLMVSDRLASVGAMAAGVAHEINNPLAALVGNLEMAEQKLLAPESQREGVALRTNIQHAIEAAGRVRRIVKDLKIFSRAEEENITAVDLHEVLESTVRLAWNEIRHRAVLTKEFGQIPHVRGNESRLSQVFLNLLLNAAQAIAGGQAAANEIRIRTRLNSDGKIAIDIRDSGMGMSEEIQKRLFTPYFTTKQIGEGTGLGLSICQRIVSSLGGSISTESELGKGSTFTVLLPRATVEDEVLSRAGSAALESTKRRGRILVIDDEAMLTAVIAEMLSPEHDVTAFTSPLDGLARIRSGERYDVIFCDLMMPEMPGEAVYRHIFELDAAQASRIIFMTGGAFTPEAFRFLDGITNPKLEKPFGSSQIRQLVNERIRWMIPAQERTHP